MSDSGDSDLMTFHYRLSCEDRDEIRLRIDLDRETLNLLLPPRDAYPQWVHLENHQCEVCPLQQTDHPYCPAAMSLVDIIEQFDDLYSYEMVEAELRFSGRLYSKRAAIQEALSSIIGVLMASSGCPIMARLKPMVRFHLPFASMEETEYRVVSMYLTAQYFIMKHHGKPDWELKNLARIYDDIGKVNRQFTERLRSMARRDAGINALIRLDCFASNLSLSLDRNEHEILEPLFHQYISEIES